MDAIAEDFEIGEPLWLVTLLLAEIEELRNHLQAGGDENHAAYLCFDQDLIGQAFRAVELVNEDIRDELEQLNPYWLEQKGEIDKEYAKIHTLLHARTREAIVGKYQYSEDGI